MELKGESKSRKNINKKLRIGKKRLGTTNKASIAMDKEKVGN